MKKAEILIVLSILTIATCAFLPADAQTAGTGSSGHVGSGEGECGDDPLQTGLAYLKKGDCDKAIPCFTLVINDENNMQRWATYSFRGLCYLKRNMYDEAIADYNEWVAFNPDPNRTEPNLYRLKRRGCVLYAASVERDDQVRARKELKAAAKDFRVVCDRITEGCKRHKAECEKAKSQGADNEDWACKNADFICPQAERAKGETCDWANKLERATPGIPVQGVCTLPHAVS